MVVSNVVSLMEWLEKIAVCIQENWDSPEAAEHMVHKSTTQVLPNWGPGSHPAACAGHQIDSATWQGLHSALQ